MRRGTGELGGAAHGMPGWHAGVVEPGRESAIAIAAIPIAAAASAEKTAILTPAADARVARRLRRVGCASLREGVERGTALAAERVGGRRLVAARALDHGPDLALGSLLAQAEVDQAAEPEEPEHGRDRRHRERPPLLQVQLGHRRADEDARRKWRREERRAERPHGPPVAEGGAEAKPEGAARRPADTRREHGHRDAERQEPRDPETLVAGGAEAEVEEVGRVRERLGREQRRGAARPEDDAVEDVVELAVRQQDQRAGEAECERDATEGSRRARGRCACPGYPRSSATWLESRPAAEPTTAPDTAPQVTVNASTRSGSSS